MQHKDMLSIKSIIFILLFLENFIIQSDSQSEGTLSNAYGRISNILYDHIHVCTALNEANCVRQCVDFSKNYIEYVSENCFAYNYDFDDYICELIHSIEPNNYTISIQSRWRFGLKS